MLFVVCGVPTRVVNNSAPGSVSLLRSRRERIACIANDGSATRRLVDADMNVESTRLKAMQTQGQLAMQALQIANTNPDHVLQLFR